MRLSSMFCRVAVLAVWGAASVASGLFAAEGPDISVRLPDDAFAAVRAHPSRIVSQTEFEILGNVPFLGQIPVPPTRIAAVTVVWTVNRQNGDPETGLVLRMHGDVFRSTVLRWLLGTAEEVPGATVPTYRRTADFGQFLFVAFPNAQTIVASSSDAQLQSMMSGAPMTAFEKTLLEVDPRTSIVGMLAPALLRSTYSHPLVLHEPGSLMELVDRLPRDAEHLVAELRLSKRENDVVVRAIPRPGCRRPQLIDLWMDQLPQTLERQLVRLAPLVKERLSQDDGKLVDELQGPLTDAIRSLKPGVDAQDRTQLAAESASLTRLGKSAAKLLLPAVQLARNSARDMQTSNQFKQIALAWMNHADRFNVFPGNILSADGKPLLSWRVRILPFLGSDELTGLFNQFKFDEPWDSPHNLQVGQRMPLIYQSVTNPVPGQTQLQAIQGEGCVLPGPTGFRSFVDGRSNTILLAEAAQPVPWTSPQDLPFSRTGMADRLKPNLRGESLVVFADGSTRRLARQSDDYYTAASLLADGGILEEQTGDQDVSPINLDAVKSLQLTMLFLNLLGDPEFQRDLIQWSLPGGADPKRDPYTFKHAFERLMAHEDSSVRTAALLLYLARVNNVDWGRVGNVIEQADAPLQVNLLRFVSGVPAPETLQLVLKFSRAANNRALGVELLAAQYDAGLLAAALPDAEAQDVGVLCTALGQVGGPQVIAALEAVPDGTEGVSAAREAIASIRQRAQANDEQAAQERQVQARQRQQLWNEGQAAIRSNKPQEALQKVRELLRLEEQQVGETSDDVLSTLNWLADASAQFGETAVAIEMLKTRAERLAQRHGATDPIALEGKSRFELFRQRAELPADRKAIETKANTVAAQAREAFQQGKPADALTGFREAASLYEQALGPDSILVANMLRDVRNILVQQRNYVDALKVAQRVYQADVAVVGTEHIATVNDEVEVAYLLSLAGEKPRSFQAMREVLPRLRKHQKNAEAANVLGILGRELLNVDLAAAAGDLKAGIELSDRGGDPAQGAALSTILGRIARASGDLDGAEAWWYDSYWRFAQANPVQGALDVLPELAMTYRARGQKHLELTMHQTTVESLRQIPPGRINPIIVAASLTQLAETELSLGDFSRASRSIAEAFALMKDQQPAPLLMTARTVEARVLENASRPADAEASLEEAIKLARSMAPQEVPRYQNLLARFLLRQGQPERALKISRESADEAIKLPSEMSIEAVQLNGFGALALDKREDALSALKTSDDLLRRLEQTPLPPERWIDQARLSVELGQNQAVKALCERALSRSRNVGDNAGADRVELLSKIARLMISIGDPASAEGLARQALASATELIERSAYVLSPRQQMALAGASRIALDVTISARLSQGKDTSDLYAEIFAWKGGTLIRQRAVQRLRQDEGVLPFYEQLGKITSQLSSTSRHVMGSAGTSLSVSDAQNLKQVEDLARIQELLETQLSAARLAYLDLEEPSTLNDLVAGLPADACLVDYFVFMKNAGGPNEQQPHLLATVIRDGRVQFTRDLGPLEPVRVAISAWRQSLGQGDASLQAGLTLRRMLIDPLSEIGGAKTLLISPDGPLGALSFAALPFDDGTFLIEKYRLAVVPAPQLYAAQGAAAGLAPSSVLAVGDVDYGEAVGTAPPTPAGSRSVRGALVFDRLPGTAAEVDAIRSTLSPERITVDVLSQGAATEDAFRDAAPKHRLLHVATHGFFADPSVSSSESARSDRGLDGPDLTAVDSGLLSGLAFAMANRGGDGQESDGILTASEIAILDLNAVELAVLSACETGLGKEFAGEGLVGIQRAFQAAGARSTISSLWKVNDHATQVLMNRFYAQRLKGMNDLDALREAQLWMLRNPREVWAASTAASRGDRRVRPDRIPSTASRLFPEFWAAFTITASADKAVPASAAGK